MQSVNKKLGRYYLDELNVNPHFDGYETDVWNMWNIIKEHMWW